jgi:HPt (histidine-containing phosphotransfer) domain-containing protein
VSEAALWVESRPLLLARVEAVERALRALGEGALAADDRAAAVREAHRLAGALGVFGAREGARRARALERALREEEDDPALAAEAAALRALVEGEPPGPAG